MKVTLRGTRQHGRRQLHVSTWHQPNFIEKWLLVKSPRVVNYVGSKDKWFIMELGTTAPLDYTPLTNKTLVAWLNSMVK